MSGYDIIGVKSSSAPKYSLYMTLSYINSRDINHYVIYICTIVFSLYNYIYKNEIKLFNFWVESKVQSKKNYNRSFNLKIERNYYHCAKCGLCRVGNDGKYIHCDTCNTCVVDNTETHVCRKDAFHTEQI